MRLSPSFLAFLLTVQAALAQDAYLQIEALPNLARAQERAEAYEDVLSDVNGFALGGSWYGLALGPYDPERARAELRRLRREGLVPRDSYVTLGETYREQFWPRPDAAPAEVPETDAVAADAADAVAEPVDPARVAVPSGSLAPEETLNEARASEAALDREARRELQRALEWFGHYDAAIDGAFGRGTRRAMSAWQDASGLEPTGVLTTRQRARLLEEWIADQGRLGLARLSVPEAGVSLTGPIGLVQFDRIEAPFVHYVEKDGSGMRMSLISQAGDRATLAGLYEILQALAIVPPEGPRAKERDAFRIRGETPGRATEAHARHQDGHVFGYLLSWPEAEADAAARALEQMDATLASTGAPLDPEAGFDPAAQSLDMVSGLELRRPLRSASGFFVDGAGAVVTAADTVSGCGRVTLDRLHDAEVALTRGDVAILKPVEGIVPVEVATLAPTEGRLRSTVSVAGFPFGGVLGAATLSFGTLEDVRGLGGEADAMRLSLEARAGDAGGPVLDAAGRVAGMLLPEGADGDRVLPADVALAWKSGALLDLLSDAGVSPTVAQGSASLAPEDLTARAAGMTVLVSCWE